MALENLDQWRDKFGTLQNVQDNDQSSAEQGGFLSGESAVLVAGDPTYNSGNMANLVPVGLVQQAQISQNKQINEIFEIGSRVPFYIPGRHIIRVSLSRVLFDGPSLFYALYRNGSGAGTVPAANFPENLADIPSSPYPQGAADENGRVAVNNTGDDDQTQSDPGRFWVNLGSSVFNKPLGLGLVLYDMEGQPYGGAYLEECQVQAHNFGVSANQTVLAESISLTARRIKSISAKNIPT